MSGPLAIAALVVQWAIVVVGSLGLLAGLGWVGGWFLMWILRIYKAWWACLIFVQDYTGQDGELRAEWRRRRRLGHRLVMHFEIPGKGGTP